MKHLIILCFVVITFYSCKNETTYDYIIYNYTTFGNVKVKSQTIDLSGDATFGMNLQSAMGVSIYTQKQDGKATDIEQKNNISVIKNISILLNDSILPNINPIEKKNWQFQRLNAHHGTYSLYLLNKNFK
jgi:hypothetical protein